jgi:hypothetical protein
VVPEVQELIAPEAIPLRTKVPRIKIVRSKKLEVSESGCTPPT